MISIVWVRLQKYNFYFETKRKNGIFLLFSFGFQEMEDFRRQGKTWREDREENADSS